MVCKQNKYQWKKREQHFQLLDCFRSERLNMERQIMLGCNSIFEHMSGEYKTQPLSFGPELSGQDLKTCSEGERGTTIPQPIPIKE
jgi:hypothetical protein